MRKKFVVTAIVAFVIGTAIVWQNSRADESPAPSQNAAQSPSDSGGSEQASETNQVNIADFAFTPNAIKVKKGTTVTWTNQDNVQHNVVPDKPRDEFRVGELLNKNESYEVTFSTPGSYSYHCSPHPSMTGTVVVTE